MDDRTDPDELLRLAGHITRLEARQLVGAAYERVEHLADMTAAPAIWRKEDPFDEGAGLVDRVRACLAWAREVEHEKLSDLWLLETTGGYGAPAGHGGLDYVLEAIDLGARLAQAAIIRRAVRWPR